MKYAGIDGQLAELGDGAADQQQVLARHVRAGVQQQPVVETPALAPVAARQPLPAGFRRRGGKFVGSPRSGRGAEPGIAGHGYHVVDVVYLVSRLYSRIRV